MPESPSNVILRFIGKKPIVGVTVRFRRASKDKARVKYSVWIELNFVKLICPSVAVKYTLGKPYPVK